MIAINVSVAISQLPIRQLCSFGKRSNPSVYILPKSRRLASSRLKQISVLNMNMPLVLDRPDCNLVHNINLGNYNTL